MADEHVARANDDQLDGYAEDWSAGPYDRPRLVRKYATTRVVEPIDLSMEPNLTSRRSIDSKENDPERFASFRRYSAVFAFAVFSIVACGGGGARGRRCRYGTGPLPTGDGGVEASDGGSGSSGAGACTIGGTPYASGAANPGNVGQVCAPGTSTTSWSSVSDGTSCGSAEICNGGSCFSNFCDVGGTFYASGAANPSNSCQSCEPVTSTSAWTPVADGTRPLSPRDALATVRYLLMKKSSAALLTFLVACAAPSPPVVAAPEPPPVAAIAPPPSDAGTPSLVARITAGSSPESSDTRASLGAPAPATASPVPALVESVTKVHPELRACYNEGLRRDPRMEGTLRITAHLEETGAVALAQISALDGLDADVAECIRSVIASAAFPPSAVKRVVVVPVQFRLPPHVTNQLTPPALPPPASRSPPSPSP